MDELSRKFRSIDWKGLQKQARKVQASTASALKDMVMTDLENKTRAATADTSWGASGSDLMAIAHGTYRREDYALIMSIVWQRLASSRRRCVYKALELLKFLVMHGATRCTDEARAALPHLRALTEYVSADEHGRDVGDGVRKRAATLCAMLSDDGVLDEERSKSRDLRSKLTGGGGGGGGFDVSSNEYQYRTSSSATHQSHGQHGANGVAGTPTFKGYGDDDDDDAGNGDYNEGYNDPHLQREQYDDTPTGLFAQRAKQAAGVHDLLGDDAVHGSHNQVIDGDDDDDDDFNPRGDDAAAAPRHGDDDLLSALDNANTATTPAKASGSVPTSQLVLQLAAQQQQQQGGGGGMQLAVVNGDEQQHEPQEMSMFAGETAPTPTSMATTTTVPSGEKRVLTNVTEKEKDPFADLVSSGKQSGML